MAALDWSQCPAVESIPGKVSGAWVFRDTRLPVATVIENLEDLSVEEVMEQFDVTREQITAVLEFVAQSLKVSAPAQVSEPVDAPSLLITERHGALPVRFAATPSSQLKREVGTGWRRSLVHYRPENPLPAELNGPEDCHRRFGRYDEMVTRTIAS